MENLTFNMAVLQVILICSHHQKPNTSYQKKDIITNHNAKKLLHINQDVENMNMNKKDLNIKMWYALIAPQNN